MRISNSTAFPAAMVLVGVLCCAPAASAQCKAPEVVPGADEYNALVCKGYAAVAAKNYRGALAAFLSAADKGLLEFPNLRLFGRIAYTYAKLGRFQEAERYFQYEDLSLLWLIGVVRCKTPDLNDYWLEQDGERLPSAEASHMVNVLCGPIYDEYQYFRDRDASSFATVAQMILRHAQLKKDIDALRRQKQK